MKEATVFETRRSDIRSATERLITRRPFLEPILGPYAAICLQKINLVEKLESVATDGAVIPDPKRLERGIPLIDGENVKGLKASLDLCFSEMVVVLKNPFPGIEKQIDLLAELDRQENLGELAGAYLIGDTARIEEGAAMRGVDLGVLNLLLHCTLGPALARVALRAGITGDDFGVNEGTCPVCGFLPAVSSLSPAGDLGSEFLRGGGGQRWLHCALCGFGWRIARGKCPACSNQDPEKHRVYQVEGDACGERLDICLACNAYLPGIDLRESPSPMPLEIAAVGMLHLDAWASENGYHPLVQTPWNIMK